MAENTRPPQSNLLPLQNKKEAEFYQKDFVRDVEKDLMIDLEEIRNINETVEFDPDEMDKTKCEFHKKMTGFRIAVNQADAELSPEKDFIKKFVDNLKVMKSKGESYSKATEHFSQTLVEYGAHLSSKGNQIGNTFATFSTVFREMARLVKTLILHLSNMLTFPLDSMQKNLLKQDRRKKVDKSYHEFDQARSAIESARNRQLRKTGQPRMTFPKELFTVELLKERRKAQYDVGEFWHWFNDVNLKKEVEFASQLVNYFHMLQRYFVDGSEFLQALNEWAGNKSTTLAAIKQVIQTDQKELEKTTSQLRDFVIQPPDKPQREQYSLHMQKGDLTDGTEKQGILFKRSEGIVRKIWQKRTCEVNAGMFMLSDPSHARTPPTLYPMLTCAVNSLGEVDPKKFAFQLITSNKTIVFGADSKEECEEWISVLRNAKNQCMDDAFKNVTNDDKLQTRNRRRNKSEMVGIVKGVILTIRQLPGNNLCADCNCPEPSWFSVNLGVLICIECSGLHREMGVQMSRIRSLELDDIKNSELLTARMMGNDTFNDTFEAGLSQDKKLTPTADMDMRRQYIRQKYIDRKYVAPSEASEQGQEELVVMLHNAVVNRHMPTLLQAFGERVDFSSVLPNSPDGSSIIHFAVEQDDNTSLHMVDFLVSNSQEVVQKDLEGNTPLHVAARYGKLNCMKLLLLKTTGEWNFQNSDHKTPLDIAKESGFEEVVDLLSESKQRRIEISLEFNDIDWGLTAAGTEGLYEVPVGMTLTDKDQARDDPINPPSVSSLHGHEHLFSGSLEPGEFTPPIPPRRVKGIKSDGGSSVEIVDPDIVPEPPDTPKHANGPPIPPRPYSHQAFLARALYDCEADHPDELSFKSGDDLVVTQILDEDWWRGFLVDNRDEVGVFPSCYAERVEGFKIQSATT